jgi:hypothetical protein
MPSCLLNDDGVLATKKLPFPSGAGTLSGTNSILTGADYVQGINEQSPYGLDSRFPPSSSAQAQAPQQAILFRLIDDGSRE